MRALNAADCAWDRLRHQSQDSVLRRSPCFNCHWVIICDGEKWGQNFREMLFCKCSPAENTMYSVKSLRNPLVLAKKLKDEWCWGVSWKTAKTVKWKQRANQKAREKSKGNTLRKKRLYNQAKRPEQKTKTKIYLYMLQTLTDHHPQGLETFLLLLL